MAQDKHDENIRFYGGDDSSVYYAPKGTTLPAPLAEPGLEYEDAGLLHEDGVDLDQKTDSAEVKVHQGARVARKKLLGTVHTFKFICSETTAKTLGLLHPAAEFTTTAGITRGVNLHKTKRDEKVFIIDEFDETIHKRLIYTRAEITDRGTVKHKAAEGTSYEFTVESYGEIIIETNDPAVAVPAV